MTWVAVAIGGALGSLARVAVGTWLSRGDLGRTFPIGVFAVNVAGCLAIGALGGALASGRLGLSESARAFLVAGVLGGFTTFSSFGLDTHLLVRSGATGLAAINVVGQLVLGLGAVALGFAAAAR